MLYLFDEIEKLDEKYLPRNLARLSQERRDKVFSYCFQLDKKLSAAAYLLLRLALEENYGIDEPVVFSYGNHGKPYLRDYPRIHFNLSHCKNAVACVLSAGEIGVDVQEIIPVSDTVARSVLTQKEYAEFKISSKPFELFCEYWTIKESYVKRTGQGIQTDFTELAVDDVGEKMIFKNSKGYCCCVAGVWGRIERVGVRMPEVAYL